jgi:hypothetical protein
VVDGRTKVGNGRVSVSTLDERASVQENEAQVHSMANQRWQNAVSRIFISILSVRLANVSRFSVAGKQANSEGSLGTQRGTSVFPLAF